MLEDVVRCFEAAVEATNSYIDTDCFRREIVESKKKKKKFVNSSKHAPAKVLFANPDNVQNVIIHDGLVAKHFYVPPVTP